MFWWNQAGFSHYTDTADQGQVTAEEAFNTKHSVQGAEEEAFPDTTMGCRGMWEEKDMRIGQVVPIVN